LWARITAATRIVNPIKSSAFVKNAAAKWSAKLKGTGWYARQNASKGSVALNGFRFVSTCLSVTTLMLRFAAKHPYRTLAVGGAAAVVADPRARSIFLSQAEDWLDDDVKREMADFDLGTPQSEHDKYEISDADYDEMRAAFFASMQETFPEEDMSTWSDSDMTEWVVTMMREEPVGALQVILTALTESGFVDPTIDVVPGSMLATAYDMLSSAPDANPDELAIFGELVNIVSSAAELGEVTSLLSNPLSSILRLPSREDVDRVIDARDDEREQREAVRDLVALFGTRERLVKFTAYVLQLEQMREKGEDVSGWLEWLRSVRI
jgi:hypothetical protein